MLGKRCARYIGVKDDQGVGCEGRAMRTKGGAPLTEGEHSRQQEPRKRAQGGCGHLPHPPPHTQGSAHPNQDELLAEKLPCPTPEHFSFLDFLYSEAGRHCPQHTHTHPSSAMSPPISVFPLIFETPQNKCGVCLQWFLSSRMGVCLGHPSVIGNL